MTRAEIVILNRGQITKDALAQRQLVLTLGQRDPVIDLRQHNQRAASTKSIPWTIRSTYELETSFFDQQPTVKGQDRQFPDWRDSSKI
ncbi:hypothetical protein AVEN_242226-1 [Araneus ventricosus]|uniref:Uncharacterized protein n=1 Tax=Araneus ventricosus TaxID=182803 RepID=A0A4Y2FSI9_ARAVE|nr:hypothetical protein AVEN_242226-1 [Araneus ventricosus]